MTAVYIPSPKGRNFTAEELVGRRIRIEGPANTPVAYHFLIFADDELVTNITKLTLSIEPDSLIEATITLLRSDLSTENMETMPTETVTLRDDIELSFSAIASEVS